MKVIKQDLKRVIICIIISAFIEILICNYPAIRTLLIGNRAINARFTMQDNIIEVEDINTRVTSVNINYSKELSDKVTYFVSYIADDNSAEIRLRDKINLKDDIQCVNLDSHAKVKKIKIEILTKSEISIKNVIINHCNFRINIYRIIVIFSFVILFYKLYDKSLFNEKFNQHEKFHNQVFLINLIIFCFMICIYVINQFNEEIFLINPSDINKEECILMQAESIVNGKIKLLETPSDELIEMQNPYDSVKRDENAVPYLYDVAYYNGSYYNYFGIAPIILLIIPFRLITGKYIGTYLFNLVFIIGIIFSLYGLVKKLVKEYIPEISLCNFYLGYFSIIFASNFLTLLRGAKYDIVVSSGIMFLLISLNLAMSINKESLFKYLKLILLGFATGFIVLSKPNLIVYYPIIFLFIYFNIKDLEIKKKIIYILTIIIPLGILAIFQMILNYIRFDSIFEFGAKYQLTGFNMNTCMGITFGKILQGVGEYLFTTPTVNPFVFPFVFINTSTLSTTLNELCYENRLIGLFAIPIFWIYLFTNNIISKDKDKIFKLFIIISIIVSVISIILNTCYGGICEAYSLDFKMILAIIAVVLFNRHISNEDDYTNNNTQKDKNHVCENISNNYLMKYSINTSSIEINKDFINKLYFIIAIATILIMIPISFTTERNFLIDNTSSQTVFLKNIFEFWN